jgi:dTMP kinase
MSQPREGRYVVLEGIDGSGKTELADRLVPPMVKRGHSVSRFREPTDAFLRAQGARLVRRDPVGAALCFTLDRLILRPEVERCLSRGDLVLQDRSFYSTLAYQSVGLDEGPRGELERLQRTVAIEPDLVLFLDVPVDVARSRIADRGAADEFEDRTFLGEVRSNFERLFRPPRWVRLDATGSREATLDHAMEALTDFGL